MAMRKERLRAIEEHDLQNLVSELMPEHFNDQLHCKTCGKALAIDEIGAVQLLEGKLVFFCTSLECLPRSTRKMMH